MEKPDRGADLLLQKAREMHQRRQRELTETIAESSVGGGDVTAKMNGHRDLLSIYIAPERISTKECSELENMIVEVVNAVTEQIDVKLGKSFTWADTLPGLFSNFMDPRNPYREE